MYRPDQVRIGFIKINQVDHGSTFAIGQNHHTSVRHVGVKQQGFGQQGADNVVTVRPICIVSDEDGIDSNASDLSLDLDRLTR